MTKTLTTLAAAGLLTLATAAFGQTASTVGTGAAATGGGTASGTIAGGGSAAAGGTSASTVGTGATATGPSGTSSTIGSGGSAAAVDGRATSRTKINENPNGLKGQSKAMAHDGGTFSKTTTKTKVKAGEELSTRTKSMAHVPGSKPVKSTTSTTVPVGQ